MADNEMGGAGGGGEERCPAAEAERNRRAWARMTLIQEFHLESAFIGVPKLARILGVAPNTIWSYMRQKKFFIPYRMFNTSPMVCIDDLVDWYCSKDGLQMAEGMRREPAQNIFAPPAPIATREKTKAEERGDVDAIVANALAALGLDPKSRRRRPR